MASGPAALALTGARSLAITPDGARVVYVGNNDTQIFVRPLDRLEATPIVTGVRPLNWVFVSPDGQWIGFAEGSSLTKVAVTGGPATAMVETASDVAGASWAPDVSPDGRRFLLVKPANQAGTPQIIVVSNWFEELKRVVSAR